MKCLILLTYIKILNTCTFLAIILTPAVTNGLASSRHILVLTCGQASFKLGQKVGPEHRVVGLEPEDQSGWFGGQPWTKGSWQRNNA